MRPQSNQPKCCAQFFPQFDFIWNPELVIYSLKHLDLLFDTPEKMLSGLPSHHVIKSHPFACLGNRENAILLYWLKDKTLESIDITIPLIKFYHNHICTKSIELWTNEERIEAKTLLEDWLMQMYDKKLHYRLTLDESIYLREKEESLIFANLFLSVQRKAKSSQTNPYEEQVMYR